MLIFGERPSAPNAAQTRTTPHRALKLQPFGGLINEYERAA